MLYKAERHTIPGDRFWDFSLFIDVIVSAKQQAGWKEMQWGVVWDWRNGRGRGWIIRSIRLHLGTLRGFSSALILLHAILFFFQMRKAEHVTYNLEKKVYNVYNVISQIWKRILRLRLSVNCSRPPFPYVTLT